MMDPDYALKHLSDAELVAEHSNQGANSHYLSEMVRRLKDSMARSNRAMTILTVVICVCTILLLFAAGVQIWLQIQGLRIGDARAWLLWDSVAHPNLPEPYWGIIAAYSASDGGKQACDRSATDWTMRKTKVRGEAYICLPDTVDPRGPKGSAR